MNPWKKFLTKDNFILAWRRINTGSNTYYKKFFRQAYLAYEVSLEENIDKLTERIKGEAYRPCPPDRIFIPKPSGFQRPITLLTVEDQIVWQAIANVLQIKWKERRAAITKKVVFSDLPNPNKIFFFEHWKVSYREFLSQIREIYKDNKWTAHFDLAAYYDTISHDHILKLITPRNPSSDMAFFVDKVLRCWSSERISRTFSHGVPQGPIASAYIGELILFDTDKQMLKFHDDFLYLRYVDDIRLFAKDEDSVREGIIHLEQLCRNKGLVPQAKKTSVFYAKTEQDAIGKDFSLSPEDINYTMSEESLFASIDEERKEIVNVPKFKFFLFRGQPLVKHLDIILELFEKHPHLSDAFVIYLSRFTNNEKLIDYLKSLIKRKKFPYQYVEGNVWLLLSEVDPERKSRQLRRRAEAKLLQKSLNLYLRYGLLMYLAPFVRVMGKRVFNKYLYGESVLQSLLLPHMAIHFEPEQYVQVLKQCLIRTKPEAALSAVARLAYDNIKFRGLKVRKRIKPPVRNCLVALGLARSQTLPEMTAFQEIFRIRYSINIHDWNPHLKNEYEHAHQILILAEKAFDINRSSWLCSMDSFNNITVRAIIEGDASITQKTVGSDSKLVDYGSLLGLTAPFVRKYKTIVDVFRAVHKRRCSIPEAHPYELRTAKRAKFLKIGERNYYYGRLKQAYLEVDSVFQNL